MLPIIGQFDISDIARVSYLLHEQWGRIVRLGGLLGRPDLLFVYDADEIEKVNIEEFHLICFQDHFECINQKKKNQKSERNVL